VPRTRVAGEGKQPGGGGGGRGGWQRQEKNAGQTRHKKLETDSSDIMVFLSVDKPGSLAGSQE